MGLEVLSDVLGIVPQTHSGATFGNLLAVECKMPGKEQSPEQVEFEAKMKAIGDEYFVI